MPAVADLLAVTVPGPGTAVGGDVSGPVGYSLPWALLTGAALLAVGLYYAVVLWTTRARGTAPATTSSAAAAGPRERRAARAGTLAALDRVGDDVAAGRISPRAGHQRLSDLVRGYVADVSGRPARTMTLADVRRDGPPALAALLAEVYPPEFAPGQQDARERLVGALARARELVSTWG